MTVVDSGITEEMVALPHEIVMGLPTKRRIERFLFDPRMKCGIRPLSFSTDRLYALADLIERDPALLDQNSHLESEVWKTGSPSYNVGFVERVLNGSAEISDGGGIRQDDFICETRGDLLGWATALVPSERAARFAPLSESYLRQGWIDAGSCILDIPMWLAAELHDDKFGESPERYDVDEERYFLSDNGWFLRDLHGIVKFLRALACLHSDARRNLTSSMSEFPHIKDLFAAIGSNPMFTADEIGVETCGTPYYIPLENEGALT